MKKTYLRDVVVSPRSSHQGCTRKHDVSQSGRLDRVAIRRAAHRCCAVALSSETTVRLHVKNFAAFVVVGKESGFFHRSERSVVRMGAEITIQRCGASLRCAPGDENIGFARRASPSVDKSIGILNTIFSRIKLYQRSLSLTVITHQK